MGLAAADRTRQQTKAKGGLKRLLCHYLSRQAQEESDRAAEHQQKRAELEKELGVPVFVENDCKLHTLGVFDAELKGKVRSMIGVFLGTGIGAGVMIDGKLYTGFNGSAGEVGHMVIDINGPECGCGNRGCFEALASRTAIFREIQAAVKDGQETMLTDMLGKDLSDMRSGGITISMTFRR